MYIRVYSFVISCSLIYFNSLKSILHSYDFQANSAESSPKKPKMGTINFTVMGSIIYFNHL